MLSRLSLSSFGRYSAHAWENDLEEDQVRNLLEVISIKDGVEKFM